ncbi:hypothetical protein [Leifsonia sp. Root112D2]|nr:hypothetical protein [Leifsonia sp. Root112D2]
MITRRQRLGLAQIELGLPLEACGTACAKYRKNSNPAPAERRTKLTA